MCFPFLAALLTFIIVYLLACLFITNKRSPVNFIHLESRLTDLLN